MSVLEGSRAVGRPDGTDDLTRTPVRALRGVRLPDGTLGTVVLDGALVGHVAPTGAPAGPGAAASKCGAGENQDGAELDATGWRVLPAAAEPHAHLDKALTADRDAAPGGNDLVGAIEQWHRVRASVDALDVTERALASLDRYLSRGVTAVRTHVDVPADGDPLRFVDALLDVRDRVADVMTLQVCLLASSATPTDVLHEAARHGVDVLGGCPHLAPEPGAETTRLLDVAERHGLPVDLHTDEQTGLDGLDVVDLAAQVIDRGLVQRVTASHVVRLGSLTPERLAPTLDLVARAGLGLVTLPITNLYLQGWDATHLVPRGIAPLRQILDAGITLAAGADNLRDPFNPAGRADPFETTSLLMTAGHLGPDDALAAVTSGARSVLGLAPAGLAAGDAADLVLVPDVDLGDVLAGATDARVVVRGGTVVADTRVRRTTALHRTGALATAPGPGTTSTGTHRSTPSQPTTTSTR
ncbi:cytosine deaminase [Paraoerskovia sediminicola]|uniref:Cytosine deaminase n=1 Tax=Paraoerskovia sediminicola TaxID=1138587 RepID=A0ABM8G0C3_9CELL|nr:amidohydrolase family protein [Paraoerskovia sediminicola]BDZ41517.1 cytosine deaminase [Paraoerskovia sediminicola]